MRFISLATVCLGMLFRRKIASRHLHDFVNELNWKILGDPIMLLHRNVLHVRGAQWKHKQQTNNKLSLEFVFYVRSSCVCVVVTGIRVLEASM